jgi:molecular chaperone HtpG
MTVEAKSEKLVFEAEVKQLLDLVARSLYSNSEIFLRELISNASDAADKLRYEALSNNDLYENDTELGIEVEFNADNKTIVIRDNGIGMNRDEVVANLGTIARSGTRAFKEMIGKDADKDSQLIGQFGVGFYSAFIVADDVVVRTRRAGSAAGEGVCWESNGQGEYTITTIEKRKRGTEITLHIKDEHKEYLNDQRLRTIIRQYSDHIALPIKMAKPYSEDDKKKIEKGEVIVAEQEVVNQANALWTMPRNEIKDEQYAELYKHISHDFEAPLLWSHNKVEGKSEYTSLLYVPTRPPFDLWERDQKRGLKLYVRRVFIMDDADHFMPNYLRFIKGVIDTNDLPLNISRELLQSNATIDRIKSGCVKRVLSTLEKCANTDAEKYAKFWAAFGAVLKEGPAEDAVNKERIAKLLRFNSTHVDQVEQTVNLEDYIGRMKPEQDKIYYLIADSYTAAKNSPLLELFKKKGVEVLLLSERVDEWLMGHLSEFSGKKFQTISQGEVDLGKMDDEETKEKKKEDEKTFKDLVDSFKKSLGDKVDDVRITHRLTDSPACVVFSENAMSGHLQRLMQAAGQAAPQAKPILELNPDHAMLAHLKSNTDEKVITRWAELLLGQALLAEGEPMEDPAAFVRNMNTMLQETLS